MPTPPVVVRKRPFEIDTNALLAHPEFIPLTLNIGDRMLGNNPEWKAIIKSIEAQAKTNKTALTGAR